MCRALHVVVVMVAAGLLLRTPGLAQDPSALDPTARLRQAIEEHSDPPSLNTVLLFTNLGRNAAKASLKAYNAAGDPAGTKDIEVPGNGITYVLASDLDNDVADHRFIGKVEALCRGDVTGTAVLVGGAVTDLPVIVRMRNLASSANPSPTTAQLPIIVTQLIFPVVAAY